MKSHLLPMYANFHNFLLNENKNNNSKIRQKYERIAQKVD